MSGEFKHSPPNRHWVAFYTFLILLPLVYFIPSFVIDHITAEHGLVTLLSVAGIVPIVSYLALPNCLRLHNYFIRLACFGSSISRENK